MSQNNPPLNIHNLINITTPVRVTQCRHTEKKKGTLTPVCWVTAPNQLIRRFFETVSTPAEYDKWRSELKSSQRGISMWVGVGQTPAQSLPDKVG